jgi:hypothetical protein
VSLSAEVEASPLPPQPAPPPPAAPAQAAASEEGVDLQRRSMTPFTMFIAPGQTQLAAAHHRRACALARREDDEPLWDPVRIRPHSPGSERSGDDGGERSGEGDQIRKMFPSVACVRACVV